MALSGLEIYKQLPKTNCRECGFPTCLAFAMALAAKKVSLDKCPPVSEEAKKFLEGSAAPPIRLVTIGAGDKKLEVGNETVMFRHEATFYHPTGIGFLLEDSLDENSLKTEVERINKLEFERVGQIIGVNLIAIRQTGDDDRFANAIKKTAGLTNLALILISENPEAIKKAAEPIKDKRPLIYAATGQNIEAMAKVAKELNLPLTIKAPDLDNLAELTQDAFAAGVNDLILDPETSGRSLGQKIVLMTQIRRLALKKTFRPLGYPTIAFVQENDPFDSAQDRPERESRDDPFAETIQAASLIAKYASIVIMKGKEVWQALSILTARQNIFTDPQKPLQMQPNIYEVGQVTDKSPVLVTTNFSLTYFTVQTEVEASKVPAYIIAVDTEGMSVLTGWAAEKFTPEKIISSLSEFNIDKKVSHKKIIIPGYVAVMSGKLQEDSGRDVLVGPREASGLSAFLRQWNAVK